MKSNLIYVVEDDQWYSKLLNHHLSKNPDYDVRVFHSAKEVLAEMHLRPAIVTLDYSLPDTTGGELLGKIKSINGGTEVVIISGQEDIETAVELLKEGAFDYIVKNEDTTQRVWKVCQNIMSNQELKEEVEVLRSEVVEKYDFSKSIVGSDRSMKKVFTLLDKAVRTNINVSITGETGTGKEVVAKAIHYNSERKKSPFVAVNVSAIPSELIESELFGHEKGAFTGAVARRIGKFEEAENGTIFLDEIAELDPNGQSKLLRVLQEREVVRIGGKNKVKLNCRIICATHRDLVKEVELGNFRQDLYFRLIGLPINLPPLRERRTDIMLLANKFIKDFSKSNGLSNLPLSQGAKDKLLTYPYPGNVRELKAVVELGCVMSDGEEIDVDDLNFHGASVSDEFTYEELSLREFNHRIINHFMNKYDKNVMQVAEVLDIGKSTIYRMLKEMEE